MISLNKILNKITTPPDEPFYINPNSCKPLATQVNLAAMAYASRYCVIPQVCTINENTLHRARRAGDTSLDQGLSLLRIVIDNKLAPFTEVIIGVER